MNINGEDHLDLNGPMLRGPFSTSSLNAKLLESGDEDYIKKMQAQYKMFWTGISKKSYLAYKELPHSESSSDPMVRMPYRFSGDRYSIGSMVVHDAPPYPVRDTASQETYVFKSRRAAYDGAVRMAHYKTPHGSDLPMDIYKEVEKEVVEYDDNGKPIGYGRMVYISSHDALSLLTGESISKSLRSRLQGMFPHASYLVEGAPLVTAHVSGAIGVYTSLGEIMEKYDDGRLHMLDRGIAVCSAEGGRKIEEIVSGWKYAGLSRLLYEKGTGLHPSEYDAMLY
jgi:hypothetical protein